MDRPRALRNPFGPSPEQLGNHFQPVVDEFLGREVDVVRDSFHEIVGGSGGGSSPANFVGFTLGMS